MATTSRQSGGQSPSRTTAARGKRASGRSTTTRPSSTTRRASRTPRSTRSTRTTARNHTPTPTTPIQQAGAIAERVVLVPVGASLMARDNLVSTVRDLATRYSTRTNFERELKRYERRGSTARNRFERQVRRTRTRFERQLRQRRNLVQRTVKQNRRRLEREVRSVRRDLEKQSGVMGTRVERLVSDAQGLITPGR
jgi:hypothetical protein